MCNHVVIRRLVLALLLLTVLAVPVSASSYAPSRNEFYLGGLVNGTRYGYGYGGLVLDSGLSNCAHQHSSEMARSGSIYHSSDRALWACLGGARTVGENVGEGPSLGAVYRALLASKEHRDNIACKCFTRIGTGAVYSSGTWFLTMRFWG